MIESDSRYSVVDVHARITTRDPVVSKRQEGSVARAGHGTQDSEPAPLRTSA